MGRAVLAVLVVLIDAVWLVPDRVADLPWWGVLGHAAVVGLITALVPRRAVWAVLAALGLTLVTGGSFALLVCASFRAGQYVTARAGLLAAGVGAVAHLGLGALLLPAAVAPATLVPRVLLFVVLPALVGRYLAQHRRLVATLDEHNRRLRAERELLAEQERLRERLRIARDMHDSLGRRLSLVSMRAAALEVSDLPESRRADVRQLADTARAALDELHELVGALRHPDEPAERAPGLAEIDAVVAEFRAAGGAVRVESVGRPQPLGAPAEQAAYRVVAEGLTNAARHAPGQPVTVRLAWESDALLLTVSNPLGDKGSGRAAGGGHGLAGLTERVGLAGGLLHTNRSTVDFRLTAMFPVAVPAADPVPAAPSPDPGGRRAVLRTARVALGAAAAVLAMLCLPVGLGAL